MDLAEQVRAAFSQAAATSGTDLFHQSLVLGISGGPDSLALLHLVQSIRSPEGLHIAHLDHGLRQDSAKDASLVANAVGGLRFFTERVDVAEMARIHRQSIEEAGRVARYDFLTRVAREVMAPAIIVGHNADDQAETVLMHLLRGSGSSGLSGMRPASPIPGHPDLWLIRPLLQITRAEIEKYCIENGLTPVTDESNADRTYFRNRLRFDLLPLLETYNPQIRQRLREMGEVITADEDLLSDWSAKAWENVAVVVSDTEIEIQRPPWLELPLALRRRTLRRSIGLLQPALRDISFRTLESARLVAERGVTGSKATLPGGIVLLVRYGTLRLGFDPETLPTNVPQVIDIHPVPLPIPGEVELADGWRITADWVDIVDKGSIMANSDPWTGYFDIASTSLFVRTRSKGEWMRPLGLGGTTRLKEIMIDRKIPASARDLWPIVATDSHLVWVVGHVVDDRARVRPTSGRVACLRCFNKANSKAS